MLQAGSSSLTTSPLGNITFVRVLLNYVHTRFDTPVVVTGVTMAREHALVARAQIDF